MNYTCEACGGPRSVGSAALCKRCYSKRAEARAIGRLADGLYRVEWRSICAGFVIERGRLIMCAPVLRGGFRFFSRAAQRIDAEVLDPKYLHDECPTADPEAMKLVTKRVDRS